MKTHLLPNKDVNSTKKSVILIDYFHHTLFFFMESFSDRVTGRLTFNCILMQLTYKIFYHV